MQKIHNILLFLTIVFLLSGCLDKDIIDDLFLVDGIGFDHEEDGKITGTVITPQYIADKPPENITFSATNEVKKTILQDIQRQTALPIVMGSLEVVYFEDKLAEEGGILELVDAFQRDPAVGSGVYFVITEGKTKDFLDGQYGIRGNSTYVSELLRHNIEAEDLPKTNMQRFLSDFYQQGKSPYLPIMKKKSDKKVELSGIGLIRFGKLAGRINPTDAFFFKLLVDKFSNGLHRVVIEEGEASVQSIYSKHKFKLVKQDPYEVEIKIEVNGLINEFTGNRITPGIMDKLEKQLEKEIEDKSIELIQRFKELEIDPVGFGHFVSSRTRKFDFKKWNEEDYQELVVKIIPKVTIEEAGVIE